MLGFRIMQAPVPTPAQLQAVLRAMRTSRGLSQAELGRRIGVGQRRIAAIEAAPERASFDQVARIIAVLGGRLSVGDSAVHAPRRVSRRKTASKGFRSEQADW